MRAATVEVGKRDRYFAVITDCNLTSLATSSSRIVMDKHQRKTAVKRWKHAERADLLLGMPLTPEQLNRLLDYLDANLKSCDHTTKLTAIFLNEENLDRDKVLPRLAEHGGYCDCEVLANLEDL